MPAPKLVKKPTDHEFDNIVEQITNSADGY